MQLLDGDLDLRGGLVVGIGGVECVRRCGGGAHLH